MSAERNVELLLRFGLAFAFIYPALSALVNPFAWIGFFPPFLLNLFAGQETLLLHSFGVTELLIGLWILSGKKILIPTILGALYLLAIILFNVSQFDIVFRDVSILLMAFALVLLHRKGTPALSENNSV